jgi:hypothetical protein
MNQDKAKPLVGLAYDRQYQFQLTFAPNGSLLRIPVLLIPGGFS